MSDEAAVNLEILAHLPCSLPQVNAEMIKKQIEVVGAESLFHRLDKSLKDLRTEPLFIREQWNLYTWRCQFFEEHFPDSLRGKYYRSCQYGALSFLLCCKFEEVITLSLGNRDAKVTQEQFNDAFVEISNDSKQFGFATLGRCNEKFSIAALERFNESAVKRNFECLYLGGDEGYNYHCFPHQEEYPLSHDAVTAMVAELHPCHVRQVKTLENLAMKTVLKQGISMEEMSRELKKRSVMLLQGQNSNDDDNEDEEDVYVDADYDEYHYHWLGEPTEESKSWIQAVSDQELRFLKKLVSGKGLKIIRKVRNYM